ncbi:hypothetical protein [Petrachloros mirabilis]
MVLRCRTERIVVLLCTVGVMCVAGCSDAVQLRQETETGGTVTYLYKEDRGGPMGSPYRKEALQVINKKCPAGYVVVRDGEVKGYASMSGRDGREGEVTGRHWGIQFRCK